MGGKFTTYNHHMTLLTGHEYTSLHLDDYPPPKNR